MSQVIDISGWTHTVFKMLGGQRYRILRIHELFGLRCLKMARPIDQRRGDVFKLLGWTHNVWAIETTVSCLFVAGAMVPKPHHEDDAEDLLTQTLVFLYDVVLWP